jgi:hypothetical protein
MMYLADGKERIVFNRLGKILDRLLFNILIVGFVTVVVTNERRKTRPIKGFVIRRLVVVFAGRGNGNADRGRKEKSSERVFGRKADRRIHLAGDGDRSSKNNGLWIMVYGRAVDER